MDLHAQSDASAPPKKARRRAIVEVCLATLAIGTLIALTEVLARLLPRTAGYASAVVAFAFLVVPVGVARARGIVGDVHGLSGDWRKGVLWGLAATVLVAAPFALGFDVLQTQHFATERFAGPGLRDFPARFSGTPTDVSKAVVAYAEGDALAIHNGLGSAFAVDPACSPTCKERPAASPCKRRILMPAAHLTLRAGAHDCFEVFERDANGAGRWVRAEPSAVRTGAFRQPAQEQPLRAERSMWWLLWSLITQIVVVALPEEAFFRGYVQGRLRAVWQPQRKIFGTHFGAAHVVAAALFALIHLAASPAPSRLLVFFPALLFAWLAERSRTVVAPIVHHALSNLMLQAARRLYG